MDERKAVEADDVARACDTISLWEGGVAILFRWVSDSTSGSVHYPREGKVEISKVAKTRRRQYERRI